MEFPDLGKHCSEETCRQLDFLPLRCDACKQDFCKDHFACAAHNCPLAYKKDVQVPVCPLCNSPVPVRKGELADAVVGAHMDGGCKSRPRRDEKVRLGSGGRFLRGGGGPLSPPCRLAFIVAAHGEPRTRGSGAPGSGERPGSFR
uniref:AN1-type domain-containing protein n=1 Tax=Sus scrofa TaxID=9823 RepID=A0A8D0PYH8_PIG